MRSSFWKSDFGVAHILCFFLKLAGNITFFSSKTSYLQWNRACEPLQSRFFKNKIRSHIQNPYDRFADLEFPSFTWLCKSFWDLVLGKRSSGKRYFSCFRTAEVEKWILRSESRFFKNVQISQHVWGLTADEEDYLIA